MKIAVAPDPACSGPSAGGERGCLEGAHHGCAHRHDSAALRPSMVDGFGGLGGDAVVLRVQAHVLDPLDAQRSEGAEANVQRDAGDVDARDGKAVQHLRGEVEAGGGRCDGAALAGEDGLVALLVFGGVRPVDIRRQGHMTDALDGGPEVGHRREAQQALAEVAALEHLGQ